MMFDDVDNTDPRFGGGGSMVDQIPPGYRINPQTGQLELIPTYAPSDQPGYTEWAPGSSAPSTNPPGQHWDPNLARFVDDAPGVVTNPGGDGGGGGGAAGPAAGGGSLIQPFAQPYAPAGTAAPGGGQPLGSPSDYVSTIPGAPQFPTIPKFQAPTIAEAMAEPGYDFVLQQGNNNLQNWAAARGTLNDSSTAKALIDYGQGAATTQYGNVWDRAAQTYDRNTTTQYLDPFAAQYQNWMTGTVNPTMSNFSTQTANIAHGNDVRWQDNWNSWLQDWNQFRDQRDSTFNKQFQVATA